MPYKPAAHSVQDDDPTALHLPAPHTACVADVEPAGQEYPAVQLPVQSAVVNPDVLPNRPALQGLNVTAPASEY